MEFTTSIFFLGLVFLCYTKDFPTNIQLIYLNIKAWKLYDREGHIEFVDKTLDPNEYDTEEVKKIIEIGLLCTQASPAARPTMSEIVVMLKSKGLMENKKPTMPVYVDPNFRPRTNSSTPNGTSSSHATVSISSISGR